MSNSTTKARALEAKAGRLETIVVLDYDGDTAESMSKLRKEAGFIAKKLRARDRVVVVNDTQAKFKTYMKDEGSKDVVKIHVVAHGNSDQCGNFNPVRLADYFRFLIKGKRRLQFITIHSCDSAAPNAQNVIFVQQFASHLMSHMNGAERADYGKSLIVRGSNGHSYTDSEGHNWVLNDGVEPNYKDNRASEIAFLNANTKPRNAARPKYAITIKDDPTYSSVS